MSFTVTNFPSELLQNLATNVSLSLTNRARLCLVIIPSRHCPTTPGSFIIKNCFLYLRFKIYFYTLAIGGLVRPLSMAALILTNQNIDRYRSISFAITPTFTLFYLSKPSREFKDFQGNRFSSVDFSITCIGSTSIFSVHSVDSTLLGDCQTNRKGIFWSGGSFKSILRILGKDPKSQQSGNASGDQPEKLRFEICEHSLQMRRFQDFDFRSQLVKTATDPGRDPEQLQANNLIMA